MWAVDLRRALSRHAIVTLMAAACALPYGGAVVATSKPIDAGPPAWSAAATAPPGATWFIFVDDLHLDFRTTGRLRDLLKTIARELIRKGDVFGIRSSGPSSAIDLTSDRARLEDAIKKTAGNALKPSDYLGVTQEPEGWSEVRYRAAVALSAAQEAMMALEQVPDQRKAFIYLSNGYDLDPSPEGGTTTSGTSPFGWQGSDISVARLRDQLAALTREARRSQVTIFAIDPRGSEAASILVPDIDRVAWRNYWTNTRNTLRVMSEQTGGFPFMDDADVIETLKHISSAMR